MKIAKGVITVLAIGFLIYEIFYRHHAIDIFNEYAESITDHWRIILWVLLLMPVNWILESLKWKYLLSNGNISLLKALKGVWMGVALGLFTPNGVGEFFGRIWVIEKSKREQAVSASIVGSLAQLAITITVGGACIVFYASNYIAPNWLLTAQIAAVVTILIGLVSYYYLPKIASVVLSKISFFKRFASFKKTMKSYSTHQLSVAYLISFARYIVFCTQLGFLIFGLADVPLEVVYTLTALIPVYYYIQTVVPTVALSEIGVRGLILSFLFAGFLVNTELILASFIIWIVNLIIPGLVGLLFLVQTKFVKS